MSVHVEGCEELGNLFASFFKMTPNHLKMRNTKATMTHVVSLSCQPASK